MPLPRLSRLISRHSVDNAGLQSTRAHIAPKAQTDTGSARQCKQQEPELLDRPKIYLWYARTSVDPPGNSAPQPGSEEGDRRAPRTVLAATRDAPSKPSHVACQPRIGHEDVVRHRTLGSGGLFPSRLGWRDVTYGTGGSSCHDSAAGKRIHGKNMSCRSRKYNRPKE